MGEGDLILIIIAIFAIYYLLCNCFISNHNNNETFESTEATKNWNQCIKEWPKGEPNMKNLGDLGIMSFCCNVRCGSDGKCITECAKICSKYCNNKIPNDFTCVPNPNGLCNNM
jgi:hypothetical protein